MGKGKGRNTAGLSMFFKMDLFKTMEEINDMGVWEYNLEKNTLRWSNHVYKIFGEDIKTFTPTYEKFLARVHPEERERVNEAYGDALRSKKTKYDVVHRIIRANDQSVRFLHEKCENITDDDGNIIISVGIVQDITEYRKMQETLSKQNEQIKHFQKLMEYVIEHSNAAIAIHDKNLNYVYVSKNYLKQYDVKDKDIIGKHHYEVFPDLPEKWRDVHLRTLKGEVIKGDRDLFTREDGSKLWTRWESRPWFNISGDVGGLIIYTEVINDQIETEQILKDRLETVQMQKKLLEATLQSIGDAVITTDDKGIITSLNQKGETLLSTKASEVRGKKSSEVLKFIDNLTGKPNINPVETVLKTHRATTLPPNTEIIDFQSEKKAVEDSASPILGEHGKIMGTVLVIRDISKQKLQQETIDHQIQSQRLVSNISAHFAKAKPDELDQTISYTLKALGEFFETDRCYLFRFFKNLKKMDNTHEWCRKEIMPQIERLQSIDTQTFPWWFKAISELTYVYIPDVDNLPDAAAQEKDAFKSHGIKTLLSIPIVREGTLFGFLGFDNIINTYEWSDAEISLLKVISEILANSFSHKISSTRIKQLRNTDPLTGLYNRQYFMDMLQTEDHIENWPTGLMVVDLNGLKIINDALGHHVGDLALQNIAGILKLHQEENMTLARISGDEFGYIVPNASKQKLEHLRDAIQQDIESEQVANISLSVAIGFEIKQEAKKKLAEVMELAENKMYKNKLSTHGISVRNNAIKAILETLTTKYSEEKAHSETVGKLSRKIGEKLNLKKDDLAELEMAGTFHDIGKIAIPDAILRKPGKLTRREHNIIKSHTESGYRILKAAAQYSSLADDVLYHHERWDGNGYPEGLKENEIPLFSRIIAVADAFEAMITERSYKKKMTQVSAVRELNKHSGTQFDPKIVEVFIHQVLR